MRLMAQMTRKLILCQNKCHSLFNDASVRFRAGPGKITMVNLNWYVLLWYILDIRKQP